MNVEKLIKCNTNLVSLAKTVNYIINCQYDKDIVITSGRRFKNDPFYKATSYHSFGLGMDFIVQGELIFEWSYYIVQIVKNWKMNNFVVVEMEMVQDKMNQGKYHCHLAIDDTPDLGLEYFTQIYGGRKNEKNTVTKYNL